PPCRRAWHLHRIFLLRLRPPRRKSRGLARLPPGSAPRGRPARICAGKVEQSYSLFASLSQTACRILDGGMDTRISAAAADVAAHGFVYLLIGGLGGALEQGDGRHDLARLAITALGYVVVHPRLLYDLAFAIGFHAFDG